MYKESIQDAISMHELPSKWQPDLLVEAKKVTKKNVILPNKVSKMLEKIAPQKPKKFVVSERPTNFPIPGSFGL